MSFFFSNVDDSTKFASMHTDAIHCCHDSQICKMMVITAALLYYFEVTWHFFEYALSLKWLIMSSLRGNSEPWFESCSGCLALKHEIELIDYKYKSLFKNQPYFIPGMSLVSHWFKDTFWSTKAPVNSFSWAQFSSWPLIWSLGVHHPWVLQQLDGSGHDACGNVTQYIWVQDILQCFVKAFTFWKFRPWLLQTAAAPKEFAKK